MSVNKFILDYYKKVSTDTTDLLSLIQGDTFREYQTNSRMQYGVDTLRTEWEDDPEKEFSSLLFWQYVTITLTTPKFIIQLVVDHSDYNGANSPIKFERFSFGGTRISKSVYANTVPTIEYINGGTEEDYILYIMS